IGVIHVSPSSSTTANTSASFMDLSLSSSTRTCLVRPAPEPSMQDDPSVNNVHGSGSSSSASVVVTRESSFGCSTMKSAKFVLLLMFLACTIGVIHVSPSSSTTANTSASFMDLSLSSSTRTCLVRPAPEPSMQDDPSVNNVHGSGSGIRFKPAIPKMSKDVQKLNGKLARLNRFLSKSAEKSLPFFKALKKCTKKSNFQWTAKAEVAFKQMKKLIAKLLTLIAPMEKRN
nr:reverse transcriptase domain-containing protein [Tanacetum cinerariifolium]